MKNNCIKDIAHLFFEKHPTPTEDDLYNFLALVENQWKITNYYDKSCHREDIIYALEENEYDVDKIPTDLIDNMLEYFEDKLGDYGSECGWRDILNNVIEWYEEDLKEYKLED